jgi:RHS repeat-associated protein
MGCSDAYPDNVTIQSKSYTYSEAGDIKTITDLMGGVTYSYEYDNLHRLLQETTSDTALPTDADIMVYNYDDSEHINAVTSIIYNGTDYGFTYDDNGNMKDGWDLADPNNIVERDLAWNADNMPVTVTRGTTTTNLTYDGDSVRAKKVAGETTTYYISNDYEIKDGVAIKYIFAGNLRVAEVEGSTTSIFHKDHLGSSTAMTNSEGAKVEGTEYLPFGGQRSHSGTNTTEYLYTDQEHEDSTGLYNYDARLYDPVIGRFVNADSVMNKLFDPQMLNRYSYCRNNPLVHTDPTGHYLYIYGINNTEIYTLVLLQLQFIDPSVVLTEVKEGSGIYQVFFDSNISIEGHEKGHDLLGNLAESKKEHNVKLDRYSPNQFHAKKDGNSEIDWNYRSTRSREGGGPDDEGSYRRDPFIGLAHELGHSEAHQQGKQKPKDPHWDMNLLKLPSTPEWEENSIKRENDIRGENNRTLRSYYIQSDGKIRY